MTITKEYNYGADADGNRGITAYYAELDDDDADWVAEQIMEKYIDGVTEYRVYSGDYEFDVNMYDWLTDEEIKELKEEYEI